MPAKDKAATVYEADEELMRLGEVLIHPGFYHRLKLLPIRLGEPGDVSQKMEILE